MRFNEKETEYSAKQGKEIPVWKSPKYEESKKKAIEIIESKKYDLDDGDFWILMNETKNGKMAYTGLIISHNGCLKINDKLEEKDKFKPECLFRSVVSFNGNDNLIYEYNSPSQSLYEVGEVNATNCKNDYKFAMAFKRCFDRVVLKVSKLAFAGIYSDSEADEFAEKLDTNEKPKTKIDKLDKLIEEAKAFGVDIEKLKTYLGKNELSEEDLKFAISKKLNQGKLENPTSFNGD